MSDLRINDIVGSEVDGGEVRCTIGNAVDAEGFGPDGAIYSTGFFFGTPAFPTNGEAAQCAWYWDGDDPTIVGIRDNRWSSKLGMLNPGSWGIATDSEAIIKCVHDQDMIAIMTTGQSSNQTQLIANDGAGGEILQRNGLCSMTMTDNEIRIMVGNQTSIVIKDGSIRFSAPVVYVSGTNVMLGDQGGGLSPVFAPTNAVRISPAIGIVSTKVYAAT